MRRYLPWLIVALILALLLSLAAALAWLNLNVLQTMYLRKAKVNWFNTVFYEGYTFALAALFACLTVNPRPRRSQLYDISNWGEMLQRRLGMPPSRPLPLRLGLPRGLWAFWQLLKWAVAFVFLSYFNGLPVLGNVTVPMVMVLKGFGDWRLLLRIMSLPLALPSGEELISLMPTLECQYRLVYVASISIIGVVAVRLAIKLVGEFLLGQGNAWVRDFFVLLTLIVLGIVLGAPFWSMDVTTPFDFALTMPPHGLCGGPFSTHHKRFMGQPLEKSSMSLMGTNNPVIKSAYHIWIRWGH